MSVIYKRFSLFADYERVCRFYSDNYVLPNWYLTPIAFEYALYHSYFNYHKAHRFGIWEDGDEIVGFACYGMDLGECLPCVKKGYEYLKQEILEYAEKELSKIENGKHILTVFSTSIPDDSELLTKNGYTINSQEPITIYPYEKGFVDRKLPEGFSIISLDDEEDLMKIHACIWKGFDHGPTPDDDLDGSIHAGTAPNFRNDLTTIIKAPGGDYACYAGMWIDEKNEYAYLEPLATVPEYRRMGLATIALMEGMKKTVPYGAKYCYCGSREFYHAIGCETVGQLYRWQKEW